MWKYKRGVVGLLGYALLLQSCNSTETMFLPKIPAPRNNPVTEAKAALGQKLFADSQLSSDGKISCASCHHPEHAFADNRNFSQGTKGRRPRRNTPTILNAAFIPYLLSDGSANSLEDQIHYPLRNPLEMDSTERHVEKVLRQDTSYKLLFADAFGDDTITYERVTQAIASFERKLTSADSPFDNFYFHHQTGAISDSARRGWDLFQGKAGCISCHTFTEDRPFFTDFDFHNVGIGFDQPYPDPGRRIATKIREDDGKFKTPSLRNLTLTAPYMHDGRFPTLRDVVEYFDRGGIQNRFLDQKIQPLHLSEVEKTDLVHFLESLTCKSLPIYLPASYSADAPSQK